MDDYLSEETKLLFGEIHARIPPSVAPPALVFHFAVRDDGTGADDIIASLAPFGIAPGEATVEVSPGSKTLYCKLPDMDFRWERHREFCSYTFIRPVPEDRVLSGAGAAFPQAYYRGIINKPALVACMVRVAPESYDGMDPARMREHFDNKTIFGGHILGRAASVWTTFRLRRNGFSDYILFIDKLTGTQAGRALQAVLEIETYRALAMLTFPVAVDLIATMDGINRELGRILKQIDASDVDEDEQAALAQATRVSAQIEEIRARTSFRFSASAAYRRLIMERLADLDEAPAGAANTATLSQFIKRRFEPAMRTCHYAGGELESLAQRVAQVVALLHTRVGVSVRRQQRALLESMDRRAHRQAQLQHVVESFAVFAVTYYLVELIQKALEGGVIYFPGIQPQFFVMLSIVPVALMVWLVMRTVKGHLIRKLERRGRK